MTTVASGEITQILTTLSNGDRSAAAELLPLIYAELRQLADCCMQRERPDHTLQPTALVHETYLRLFRGEPRKWSDRGHFFRVAGVVMRHILVDHARACRREKRGGGRSPVPLDEAVAVFERTAQDLVALDEALTNLATTDERKARVVELRFFAGLGVNDVADALGISARTVKSDWSFAKLWLLRHMNGN
ncbi:MAG: sigma-70 family RNA polymerase sigma factor [Phycisphaerae bacterium]|jgi:RNA polymerase sigma factor (TIGR02999 family)